MCAGRKNGLLLAWWSRIIFLAFTWVFNVCWVMYWSAIFMSQFTTFHLTVSTEWWRDNKKALLSGVALAVVPISKVNQMPCYSSIRIVAIPLHLQSRLRPISGSCLSIRKVGCNGYNLCLSICFQVMQVFVSGDYMWSISVSSKRTKESYLSGPCRSTQN
jgi:hypothetical protein